MGWITTDEAAKIMGVSKRRFQNMIGSNARPGASAFYREQFKARKFGRDWQVDEEAVRAYAAAHPKGTRNPGRRPTN